MINVEIIRTTELGDRSYVVHDGLVAIVIDPQRDIARVEEVLQRLGLHCALVAETHIHNDYVTGGFALARRTGAPYVVAAADDVLFDRRSVKDGDELRAGSLTLRVMATPGHTEGHIAFVVETPDDVPVVFSGGSLLYGSVGRTDLVDKDRTEELTRAQYHSVRRLANSLDDPVGVYPTHGFGSFCSSGSSVGGEDSSVGIERTRNDALIIDDEDKFVEQLIAGLTEYPTYYSHMASLNVRGPHESELAVAPVISTNDLSTRLGDREWVIDLRSRRDFAENHVLGTINIGLGDNFSTYVGWLLPWGAPLTLLGESPESLVQARTQLARIGIDEIVGVSDYVAPAAALPTGYFRRVTFADLAEEPGASILDVRRDDETAKGAIVGSMHIPLHSLLERLDDVPHAVVWVHCASGFRASIAASLLDRAGYEVVLVDDDFANAKNVVQEKVK